MRILEKLFMHSDSITELSPADQQAIKAAMEDARKEKVVGHDGQVRLADSKKDPEKTWIYEVDETLLNAISVRGLHYLAERCADVAYANSEHERQKVEDFLADHEDADSLKTAIAIAYRHLAEADSQVKLEAVLFNPAYERQQNDALPFARRSDILGGQQRSEEYEIIHSTEAPPSSRMLRAALTQNGWRNISNIAKALDIPDHYVAEAVESVRERHSHQGDQFIRLDQQEKKPDVFYEEPKKGNKRYSISPEALPEVLDAVERIYLKRKPIQNRFMRGRTHEELNEEFKSRLDEMRQLMEAARAR